MGRAGFAMSQSRVRSSALAAASTCPFGLNAAEKTMVPEESSITASSRGRAGSLTDQIRTVPSSPPLARSCPVRLNATNSSRPVADAVIGGPSAASPPPAATRHSWTWPSPYPAASTRLAPVGPPGWKVTALTNVPATGGGAAPLDVPGAQLPNLFYLRTLDPATEVGPVVADPGQRRDRLRVRE